MVDRLWNTGSSQGSPFEVESTCLYMEMDGCSCCREHSSCLSRTYRDRTDFIVEDPVQCIDFLSMFQRCLNVVCFLVKFHAIGEFGPSSSSW